MDWNVSQVLDELPKIRRLKSVKRAWLEGEWLYIVTKNLRHKRSIRNLANMEIALPLNKHLDPGYKYTWQMNRHINPHPTISDRYFRKERFYQVCTGQNEGDYRVSRTQSPYMSVIQQLAMLQTIEPESMSDYNYRNHTAVFWAVFVVIIGIAFSIKL